MKTKSIVYFGTPEFAVAPLRKILDHGYEVPLVVTQPDRPSGRGKKLLPPPVKTFCMENQLDLIQPNKIKKNLSLFEKLRSYDADYFIVAAYGRILPKELLQIPPFILNIHASLLPRWRGASPIQHAILHGDSQTGISIMKLEEALDEGDVLCTETLTIGENETYGELSSRLSFLGGETLIKGLQNLESGDFAFTMQDHSLSTYAPLIDAKNCKINWNQPTSSIHNFVRAFSPNPGAFTFENGRRIKIYSTKISSPEVSAKEPGQIFMSKKQLWVSTKDGWLEILELQAEGKPKHFSSQIIPGYQNKENVIWK